MFFGFLVDNITDTDYVFRQKKMLKQVRRFKYEVSQMFIRSVFTSKFLKHIFLNKYRMRMNYLAYESHTSDGVESEIG